jgi:hypothetical protein
MLGYWLLVYTVLNIVQFVYADQIRKEEKNAFCRISSSQLDGVADFCRDTFRQLCAQSHRNRYSHRPLALSLRLTSNN